MKKLLKTSAAITLMLALLLGTAVMALPMKAFAEEPDDFAYYENLFDDAGVEYCDAEVLQAYKDELAEQRPADPDQQELRQASLKADFEKYYVDVSADAQPDVSGDFDRITDEDAPEANGLTIASGTCGAELKWTLSDVGTLIISGSGPMDDYPVTVEYTSSGTAITITSPWGWYVQDISKVVIGSGVTSIGEGAFALGTGMVGISIPSTVKSIGKNAFKLCQSLTSISLPNSINKLGDYAFTQCYNLSIANIPTGVKVIPEGLFEYCYKITNINIPANTTSIGDYAFDEVSLSSVKIPSKVKKIGAFAFFDNYLKTVTIPASVTQIDYRAFGANPISSFKVASANKKFKAVSGALFSKDGTVLIAYPPAKAGSFKIPSKTAMISDFAFYGAEELTAVTIPSSVEYFGWYAFSRCTGLSSLSIPNGSKSRYIDDYAFYNCTGLLKVNLGGGVTHIGRYAFENCCNMGSIAIPGSVTHIGFSAFDYCYDLEDYGKVTFSGSERLWDSIYIDSYNYCLTSANFTFASKVPAAPTNVKATNYTYNSLKVTWKAAANVLGYNVCAAGYKSDPDDLDFGSAGLTTDTYLIAKDYIPGVELQVKVQSYSKIGGKLVYSDFSTMTPKIKVVCPAPKGFKAVSTGYNSVKLSWKKVAGSSGYFLYYSTSKDGKYSLLKNITSAATLNYKHTGLKCGKTYYYKIKAYKKTDCDKVAGLFSAIKSAKPIPGDITLSVSQSGSKVVLSWDKVAGATGYQVYRSNTKNGTYKMLKSTSKRKYTDSSVKKGKTYWYKVRAFRTVDGKKVYGKYKLRSIKVS